MKTVFTFNHDIVSAKGNIPYWKIANELNVTEITLRNWMKKEMTPRKKEQVLEAIQKVKVQQSQQIK